MNIKNYNNYIKENIDEDEVGQLILNIDGEETTWFFLYY